MSTVFVSSTVYDLVDLRAEVEAELREMGFYPSLSERPNSEFKVSGYKDSIETCLVNVIAADVFVLLINQRYGPELSPDGISATHLEYRTAVKAGKRTFVYVRDKTEADFNTWKRSANREDLDLPWVKEKKDRKLFDLIREHSTLDRGSEESNWYWTFRDSIELKERLRKDLSAMSSEALLRNLARDRALPHIEMAKLTVGRYGPSGCEVSGVARNVGDTVALDVVFSYGINSQVLGCLRPGQESRFQLEIRSEEQSEDHNVDVQFAYVNLLRYKVVDSYRVECRLWQTANDEDGPVATTRLLEKTASLEPLREQAIENF